MENTEKETSSGEVLRVFDEIEQSVINTPPVPPDYNGLLGQSAVMLLAERWVNDECVGVDAIKRVYKEIYEADTKDSTINVPLLKLKMDLAVKNFDVFERLIASRMRLMQMRVKEPVVDVSESTTVISTKEKKSKPKKRATTLQDEVFEELSKSSSEKTS